MRDNDGFSLIELLIVIVILGILAGVGAFAVGDTTDSSRTNACKVETHNFNTAALAHYTHASPHVWPPDGSPTPSVQTVANALQAAGNISSAQLSRLDGSQRTPSDGSRGWTYDFTAHTASDAGC